MKSLVAMLLILTVLAGCSEESQDSTGHFYIYGKKHLFKVYAPNDWIFDSEYARKLGIGSFFRPSYAVTGKPLATDLYIYAQGWDKANKESTIENFIQSDLDDIRNRYKDVAISQIKFDYRAERTIKKVGYFVIEKLPGRYKEDCVFFDTDTAIINIVYSAVTQAAYDEHKKEFDEFLSRFSFVASDPEKIKQTVEMDLKARPWIHQFSVEKKPAAQN